HGRRVEREGSVGDCVDLSVRGSRVLVEPLSTKRRLPHRLFLKAPHNYSKAASHLWCTILVLALDSTDDPARNRQYFADSRRGVPVSATTLVIGLVRKPHNWVPHGNSNEGAVAMRDKT
ncbi:hypothetical protein GW17_00025529, partial [Ensete ventricosum]